MILFAPLLIYLTLSCSVTIESKYFAKRSASALVPPKYMSSPYERSKLEKLSIKMTKYKQNCKVVPLKARTQIKANTIFTGTVIKFYNQPNRWIMKMDVLLSRKGKFDKKFS